MLVGPGPDATQPGAYVVQAATGGRACAIAGSRHRGTSAADELHDLLDQGGVSDLIEIAATSSDARKSKPDPDIVRAALVKAGFDAQRAVMLGDTPYDVQAARSAGVGTVALRCGGWWKDRDLTGAIAIYDDPAELLSRWPARWFEGGD